jgi:mono/diheme cytochrome c family protein
MRSRTAVLALVLLTSAGSWLAAQEPAKAAARRVTDGLYSAEQATRGRAAYMKGCAACHMADLGGKEYSMPLGAAGSMAPQEYLDIVAYILQKNEYPAGPQELTGAVAAQRWPRILLERIVTK